MQEILYKFHIIHKYLGGYLSIIAKRMRTESCLWPMDEQDLETRENMKEKWETPIE